MQIYTPGLKAMPRKIALLALLLLLPIVLMLGDLQPYLRYQSLATIDHQYWRWFSGHWIHLNWPHLAMNWLALLVLFASFYTTVSSRHWLALSIVLPLLISAAFVLFAPELRWYVGLSGMLHGWFVYLIMQDHKLPRFIKSLFLIGLAGKLIWEQYWGPMPGSAELIQGNVVVDSHLYGAISGLVYYCFAVVIKSFIK